MKSVENIGRLLIIALSVIGSIEAAHPFSTDDAGTVARRESEIELNSNFKSIEKNFSYSIVHGLTEALDISLGSGRCFAPKEQTEYHPVNLGFKLAIIRERLAIKLEAPLASTEHALTAIYTHSVGEMLTINVNAGYTAERDIASQNAFFATGAFLNLKVFDVGLEFTGDKAGINFLQMGAGYNLGNLIRISAGIGIDNQLSDITASAGMTFALTGITERK